MIVKRKAQPNRRVLMETGQGHGLSLSPTEERVVRAVLAGHVTGKELGKYLGMTQRALIWHQHRVYIKTGARNLVDLVLMITGRIERPANLDGIEGK